MTRLLLVALVVVIGLAALIGAGRTASPRARNSAVLSQQAQQFNDDAVNEGLVDVS